jgi:hypothetical protein
LNVVRLSAFPPQNEENTSLFATISKIEYRAHWWSNKMLSSVLEFPLERKTQTPRVELAANLYVLSSTSSRDTFLRLCRVSWRTYLLAKLQKQYSRGLVQEKRMARVWQESVQIWKRQHDHGVHFPMPLISTTTLQYHDPHIRISTYLDCSSQKKALRL